ncbi:DNA-directed RNA polymerase subunit H [Methanothermobacter tenebrarum]|uniref:DNA-directed RNA polymerase subunit Rpo5 n=1 Tax=Methanothermobacter tenebrarum TaxID=680118 RepID=A0ABN6P9X5_9EURY|nr:DNA-directed RNA polymerase subunit H [Methanothermobacter tenebrarum]MDI6881996.1 DNA-directed RNA polymerase subunit H [Methanothermobacter sp.]BDH79001.1 DNA-directed RNA polymerase subunit H [Methanothermobacter tenebrarum]HOQ20482.1 DNA-directed RNA polymerase subunit H [Methanothermobacter sp.]
MKKDILKHQLVPEHVILSEEEAEKILEEMKIHAEQLPRIRTDDPVVKAIGAKEGDILKIIRESPTAGRFVTYRIVQD